MNAEHQKTELLTIPEASKVLRLKPSTVRSWLLKRRVPFVKLGSRVFIRLEDCLALIETGFRPAIPMAHEQVGAA
jgi:excisionase family DNA binding protein